MKRANWWFIGFTAFFAVAVCCVFWGTWSPAVTFVQPDQATFYPADYLLRKWNDFCSGGALVPGDLRFLLGGPYVWQELQYALAMYLAALGVAYYLKGRGVGPVARYGAAAAYGLMGYNFTLFSAGHLGWFVYLMYGPFCFGLVDRCVRKGKWTNWAILGGVLAWSSAQQPDLWLLFAVMAFAYGLFKLVQKLVHTPCESRWAAFVRVVAGVVVTSAVLVAAGWPQLRKAMFVETANRERQIAGSGQAVSDANRNAEMSKADREKRYVFCTNWSLPPNEVAEFFVPDLNGGSSDPRISPRNPYRGRIGMQVAPGRWQPYRQHSLYMGLITLCFAVAGVVLYLRRVGGDAAQVSQRGLNRADVIFWSAMTIVLLLCAFGAFTPFYRIVFALPVGDLIRCPVKFVHLIEWCVAVLCGFGASAVLSLGIAQKLPKVAVAIVAGLLAVNAVHLASVDSRYCAVDPADTIRIAIARETGSDSMGFAMDANAQISDAEHLLVGGTAFRDNAALKKAMSEGRYVPESFWNFRGGRFVKVAREQAGFALMRLTAASSRPKNVPLSPGMPQMVSIIASMAVCVLCLVKVAGGRLRKR